MEPSELIDARIAELRDCRGRTLDLREHDAIDEKALQALIRAAVALDTAKRTKR